MSKMRILIALVLAFLLAVAGCKALNPSVDDVFSAQSITKIKGGVMVDNPMDQIPFTVQGHSTQTGALIVAEQSDGTDVFTVSNAGVAVFASSVTGDSLVCTEGATFGGGYGSTGCTISTAGVLQCDGAVTGAGALTIDNIVCTNAATFGGGYGATGATISTAGVGTFNGAVTTDGALTADSAVVGGGYGSTGCTISTAGVLQCDGAVTGAGALTIDNIVCTNAATFGGGYGSTGATVSTAGVGQFNGALTTDGALTADNVVCTNAATFGGGYGATGCTISTAGTIQCNGDATIGGFSVAAPAAAGTGGDILDITAAFAAMDGSDTSLGIDLNLTGANATGTTNLLYGIDADLTTADPQVTEKAIDLNDADWDYAIDTGHVPIVNTSATFMDDFFGGTIAIWWTEVSGTDGEAAQAIQANAQYGEYEITSGDDNAGGCAASCEGLVLGTHYSADQGSLVFETRVHIDTAVANEIIFAGLTDNAALEMPATIITTTVTPVADDFCGFLYDDAGTTDEWWAVCADGGALATGVAATGVAPVANTYQVLRVEIDAGGEDARFYIDGTLVGTITANALTVTDLLTPMVIMDTNADESNVLDVDYVFVTAQRQ